MDSDPHDSLVEQATRGEPRALDDLLQQHLPALLAYVRLRADPLIREHESCADVVQSVCREVLEEVDHFEYRGRPAFRKWLFRKALSKLVDHKRYLIAEKRNSEREVPISKLAIHSEFEGLYADICSPSQAAMAREDLERFERAFAELPEDYQRVITLSRLVGMSHAEVAEEMGRNEGAVRVLLHRALGRLGLAMHEDAEADSA